MNNYVDDISLIIPTEKLQPFLEDSNTEAQLPERVKDGRLFNPPTDPTQPAAYNTAVLEIINDLQNIYAQLDILTSTQSSQANVSDKELKAMEDEVTRLEDVLSANMAMPTSISRYTRSKRVQFNPGDDDNHLLPKDTNHLEVDPITNLLVRPIALSSSRLRSVTNNTLVRTSIDNMLGMSVETRHPLSQAVDGSLTTYWKEVIYADAPIMGNPATTTWLTKDYTGGAAVKLRFDFENVVPVSDITIKQFCKYPMEVLNVEYASYPTYNENFIWQPLQVGSFESLSDWDYAFNGGLVGLSNPSIPAEFTAPNGSLENCFKVRFDSQAPNRWLQLRQKLATDSDTGLEANASYLLSFYSESEGPSKFNGKITASITCNTTIYGELRPITVWTAEAKAMPEWNRNEYLITLPSDISPGSEMYLVIRISESEKTKDNSGKLSTARIASVKLNKFEAQVKPNIVQTSGNTTTVNLTAGNEDKPVLCRTLWLTCVQKYYTIEKLAIPYKDVLAQNLWIASMNGGDGEFLPTLRTQDTLLKTNQNPIVKAAQSLSSKVRAMLAGLLMAADSSLENSVEHVVKYKYELGAYEIDLKFKDYVSNGMWVSKPISSNGVSFGEIRALTVQPFQGEQEATRVKLYVIPKSESPVSRENMIELNEANSYTVAFNSPEDRTPQTSVIVAAPQQKLETFKGTNRYNRLNLKAYPFTNMGKVNELQKKATSYVKGMPNRFNVYDPNAAALCYVKAPEDMPTVKVGNTGIYMTRVSTTTSYGTTGVGIAFVERTASNPRPTVDLSFRLTGASVSGITSVGASILYSPTLDVPTVSGDATKGELSAITQNVNGEFLLTYTAPTSGSPSSGATTALTVNRDEVLPGMVIYVKTYAASDPSCALYTKILLNANGELTALPGYNPISVTIKDGNTTAPPDTIGLQLQSRTKAIVNDILTSVTTPGKPALIEVDGVMTEVERRIPTNTYLTSYPIVWPANQNTAHVSVKWVETATSTVVQTLDPSEYTIKWSTGKVTRESVSKAFASTIVLLGQPKGTGYELRADYVTELTAVSSMYEDYPIPEDFASPLPIQSYPITRNITDYVYGNTRKPKPMTPDYPVYEYYVDSTGDIVFGSDLFDPTGERNIEIEVGYETLGINPRVVIEYLSPESGVSSASSPTMSGYQILLNSRTT